MLFGLAWWIWVLIGIGVIAIGALKVTVFKAWMRKVQQDQEGQEEIEE